VATFETKKGSREPSLVATLRHANGAAVDLTGATVVLNMVPRAGGPAKVTAAAVTVLAPATAGRVQYDWAAADVDTAGWYHAEFKATLGNGKPLVAPSRGVVVVMVTEPVA
jgi:hypothetical protein